MSSSRRAAAARSAFAGRGTRLPPYEENLLSHRARARAFAGAVGWAAGARYTRGLGGSAKLGLSAEMRCTFSACWCGRDVPRRRGEATGGLSSSIGQTPRRQVVVAGQQQPRRRPLRGFASTRCLLQKNLHDVDDGDVREFEKQLLALALARLLLLLLPIALLTQMRQIFRSTQLTVPILVRFVKTVVLLLLVRVGVVGQGLRRRCTAATAPHLETSPCSGSHQIQCSSRAVLRPLLCTV